jgi:hypothetical protein
MPPRVFFELRIFTGSREVKHGPRPREALDWEAVEETRRLLARHLLGAVMRDGSDRAHAHMYHLTIHPLKPNGEAEWKPVGEFALPYGTDEEARTWL